MKLITDEDKKVAFAVEAELDDIAGAVDLVVGPLGRGVMRKAEVAREGAEWRQGASGGHVRKALELAPGGATWGLSSR